MKQKKCHISRDVIWGKNITLDENVKILGCCKIGDNVKILSGSRVEDSVIGNDCVIDSSIITESNIGNKCKIGPFSHIRPNCILADGVKVGSFVELKNAHIGEGSKIPHLSYVGDAEIGENVNIGCGVVFANYDGKKKQLSRVGNNVFIGCNVNLVAPVDIADDTYICAGTTVTKNTEKGDFVIGRVRQENKKKKN